MASYDYELAVIGAGPGGYVAAIRASQLGLKAVVIERDRVGGVCLNMGCIPSKALIHQAGLFLSIKELKSLGVEVDPGNFSYQKVFAKSRRAADTLSKGVNFLLKKNKIDLIQEEAVLEGVHEIGLSGGKKISAKNILIATGSRPRGIPGFDFDEKLILSSNGALMLEELSARVCILGGGAIGVEFAHIMNAFGVEVHLVEMLERILPLEDEEVVQVLAGSFRKRGIKLYTGTKALSFKKGSGALKVILENKEGQKIVEADLVLVVVGRAPNTDGIGLEKVGIKTDRGFIPVGDYYQTGVAGIFAVGDVIDSAMLAHAASKEGEIAVEYMAGIKTDPRLDPLAIPSGVYCEPQVASFGYTENRAREEGIDFKKSVFPYRGAGKSVAVGKSEGLVKIITDSKTNELLGAHLVGAEATELIHELLLAKTSELLPEDVAAMIHAHPTLSEAVMEAARAAEGWAIHI